MKVLVCGGRTFGVPLKDKPEEQTRAEQECVMRVLSGLPITHLIHGGAAGADTLAGKWAKEAGIPCDVFPAEWDKYGRAAGHIRNSHMLERGKPDLVVAFPGGPGTADMVRRATSGGVNIE